MRSRRSWGRAGLVMCGLVGVGACGGSGAARVGNHDASTSAAAGTGGASAAAGGSGGASTATGGAGGATAAGGSGGAAGGNGGAGGSAPGGASGDAGVTDAADTAADPCGAALFCEKFDDYAGITTIADKQKLGPWHATLEAGATMGLDGLHTTSGTGALHVHIDDAATAGGRLFADGAQPLFANTPTHVYGRMMMYIDPNGTSNHWTFFGVNGDADPNSPAVGRAASYLMSSLPKAGVNTYSFVYGLAAQGTDAYHDCSSQSATSMPSAWACISFEMDSVARTLRMYKDGAPDPILSVDDHGKDCVAPTSVTSPWYGPSISQLYVGAWSFHAMNAPLDVWIDDLIVDTKPVSCPPP